MTALDLAKIIAAINISNLHDDERGKKFLGHLNTYFKGDLAGFQLERVGAKVLLSACNDDFASEAV